MSDAKHTPGPWHFDGKEQVYGGGGGGNIVCLSPAVEGWDDSAKRWDTNAHLIAAAPDMLEALEYLRRFIDASRVDVEFVDAAIKKARGEK